ncbi:MAG: carboxypeptidase regulatory-like domain-containing protein [Planctomycetes bacterium]|nr:carboxypeptidase regulatory-like domain-containing protein [Planctomycetota bacterium]
MAGNRGMLAAAAVLGAAVIGVAAWLLLDAGPSTVDPGAPSPAEPASLPSAAPGEASPAAAAATAPLPSAGGGIVLGRLVRGTPPLPVRGTVRIAGEGGAGSAVESGEDGRFRVEGLPRGRWLSLTASAEGLLEGRWPRILVPLQGRLDLGDLLLGPGLPLDVLVRDSTDRPVAGAKVSVARAPHYGSGGDWILGQLLRPSEPPPEAEGTTGADGRFRFDALPPGNWMVAAEAPSFAKATASASLAEGAAAALVRLLLQPACRLEGTVSGPDGKPLPGIAVEGTPVASLWGWTGATVAATSDPAGRWALEGLPPGEVWLWVRPRPGLRITVVSLEVPEVPRFDIRLAGSAEVRGKVLDGAAGTPVAGASVTLQTWSPDGGTSGQAYAMAASDDAGEFRIPGLPAATMGGLNVRAEGYLAWPDGVARASQQQQNLSAGEVREVEARLRRGAAVRGRVTDRGGAPIADAAVQVHGWHPNFGMVESATVRTAADGTYRIENVDAGRALVSAAAEGRFQVDYPADPWNVLQQGKLPESCTVEVPAEGEVVRDLLVAAGGTVEGTVFAPDGKPAAGIRVHAMVKGGGWAGGSGPPTDAEGRFRVAGARAGEECIVSAGGQGGETGASEPFRLEEGGTATGIRIDLKGGCSISGRVRREDGSEARGARLRLAQGALDPNQPWNWEWQRKSAAAHPVAADGSFRIERLAAGKYTFLAGAEGAADAEGPVVEVAAGEAKDGVEIVLRAGGFLAGRVLDGEERPVPGAGIRVARQAGGQGVMWGGQQTPLSAVSGPDGSFRVEGLGEGTYDLSADFPGLLPGRASAKPGAADLVLVLRPGGAIAGVVVDEGTGAPVPDLPVVANPAQPKPGPWMGRQATTGKDGTFRLDGLDPEGEYQVTAGQQWGEGRTDHAPKTVNGVKPGAEALRIEVAPGLPIAGRITDEKGTALTGSFTIQALGRKEDGSPDWSRNRWAQTTKGDGTFRLSGLTAGAWDLTVSDGTGADWSPSVMKGVAAGTEGLVVVMRQGVAVKGRVVDDRGETVTGKSGWIQFGPAGENLDSSIQLQQDGTFSTAPLDPTRTYDFVVQRIAGFMGGSAKGVSPGGGEVVIRLSRGASLSGRVVDGAGAGLRGVPVSAAAEGAEARQPGGSSNAVSGDDGSFTIQGLGEFKFRLATGGSGSDWQRLPSAELHAAGAADVVLEVKSGVSISGRLLKADGTPFKAQSLGAAPEGAVEGTFASWGRVGDDGSFTVKGLAPGRYVIRAWSGQAWVDCGTFEAPAENVQATMP